MKRGAVKRVTWVIIGLLILILSAAIIIWFIISMTTGPGGLTSTLVDSMCIFGTNGRDAVRLGGAELFPELCSLRTGNLDATDLRSCPYFHDKLEEKNIQVKKDNKDYIYSICAAEQMMELMRRCWVIRGSGNKDAGDFDCFRANISAPADVNIKISMESKNDFKNLMKRIKYDGKINYSEMLGSEIRVSPKELFDKDIWKEDTCIEKGERWAIFYNDDWYEGLVITEDDELLVGCTLQCNNDKNCMIARTEEPIISLSQWWDMNIEGIEVMGIE